MQNCGNAVRKFKDNVLVNIYFASVYLQMIPSFFSYYLSFFF